MIRKFIAEQDAIGTELSLKGGTNFKMLRTTIQDIPVCPVHYFYCATKVFCEPYRL